MNKEEEKEIVRLIKDTVSIIIPVFNAEDTIEKCVYSIIDQTYGNLDIILIDDGSTDDSLKILNRIKEEDNRIRVFSKINEGVSKTRNFGLKKLKGEYLMFVDADDWAEMTMIEDLLEELKENKLDLVQANFVVEEDKKIVPLKHINVDEKIFDSKADILNIIAANISDNKVEDKNYSLIRQVQGKLYKTPIILQNDLSFKEDLIIFENLIFNLEYLMNSRRVKFVQKYFIHLNKHKEALTSKYIDSLKSDSLRRDKYVKDIIKDIKADDYFKESELKVLDKAYSYFVLETLKVYYDLNLNKKEAELSSKERKDKFLELAEDLEYKKHINNIAKDKLNDKELEFFKKIKRKTFWNRLFG